MREGMKQNISENRQHKMPARRGASAHTVHTAVDKLWEKLILKVQISPRTWPFALDHKG